MSDTKHPHSDEQSHLENTEAEAATHNSEQNKTAAKQSSAGAADFGDVLEKLNEENHSLKDRVMRIAAEMENLRKRTARDIADAKAYAVSSFARDMLSVADNLGRALSAIPAEARSDDAALKSLAEGVEMTERAMISAMQNHGVRRIAAIGQKFDPHLHQAIFEAADKSVPHNTVSQELQAGYTIGDRVLRAAQVGIATGGEKQAKTEKPKA